MSDLEWYPQEWVDESCPPSKPSPDGFIIRERNIFMLGYTRDERGVGEEDRDLFNQPLENGDTVAFVSCERFEDVEVTLRRDGTFELHGELPVNHNTVMVNWDVDTIHQGFDALIEELKTAVDEFHVSHLIFDAAESEKRVVLQLARWSDSIPHLFEVQDGKPAFRPVPAQKH